MRGLKKLLAAGVMLGLASGGAQAGGTPKQSWAAKQVLKQISSMSDRPHAEQIIGLPVLVDALYSSNPVIAEAAASEIAQLEIDVQSAVPHVIERMRRVGGRDASLYALILAKIGSPAVPALHAALNSRDAGLRNNVCKAFTLMDSQYSADNRCRTL